jgi:MFS transporter, OFA family, oxalate/formate antiporter
MSSTPARWPVVAGAILIQLCLGTLYTWPAFTLPLVESGWSRLDTQVVFAIGLLSFALTMIVAGRHIQRWGPQRMAILGGITLGCGYLIAGLAGGDSYWGMMIGVSIIGGIGIGICYVVPIAVGMNWFPDHKGMITGVAVAGFGFGAMIWVKLADSWGNLLVSIGLANTLIVYGAIFITLIVIGSRWMRFPPHGWRPANWQPAAGSLSGGENFSVREMLHTPQYYLIVFIFTVTAGAGLMSIGLMKLYPGELLQANGYSALEASAIAGTAMAVFFSLANGIGRIVWGMLSDSMGRRQAIALMAATQGLTFILFSTMAGNEYLLYLAATLIGFNYGGSFALFPALTADQFGNKSVGQNYPWVFLAYGLGGILFPILGGMLGDMGDFAFAFTLSGLACLVGALAAVILFHPHRDEANLPFTLHGFVHQLHLFDHEEEKHRS